MKQSRGYWILGIGLVIVLALLPWVLGKLFAPLRPPVLEETATVYFVTENAYLTREAALELSATSEMFTLPPVDDEPLPGDPDYTPPASRTLESSSQQPDILLVQLAATPMTLTGISSVQLERYSCPSPSDHRSGLFPPNQTFPILGWNVDLDNVTYLLIEDDPTKQQVWLRVPDLTVVQISGIYLDTPTITCRTYVIETSPSTGQVVSTGPVTNDTTITATFTPPRVVTVTPSPPIPVRLEIAEQDAVHQVQESVPELRDVQIEITPEGLEIRGYIDLPGPLGTTLQGDVVITAELVQQDGKLQASVTSVAVAGRDITSTDDGQRVENAINNWFNTLFVRRDLQAFELLDGLLIIDVLERQFSQLPDTPQQTEQVETATIVPQDSATATVTLIVSTATPTLSPTPLPMWTQTPVTPAPGG